MTTRVTQLQPPKNRRLATKNENTTPNMFNHTSTAPPDSNKINRARVQTAIAYIQKWTTIQNNHSKNNSHLHTLSHRTLTTMHRFMLMLWFLQHDLLSPTVSRPSPHGQQVKLCQQKPHVGSWPYYYVQDGIWYQNTFKADFMSWMFLPALAQGH